MKSTIETQPPIRANDLMLIEDPNRMQLSTETLEAACTCPVTLIPEPIRAMLRMDMLLPRARKSTMLALAAKRTKFRTLNEEPSDEKFSTETALPART
jgi:hypothetical protein